MTKLDRLFEALKRSRRTILDGDEKRADRLKWWLNRHMRSQELLYDSYDAIRDKQQAKIDRAIERMLDPFWVEERS